jgi:lysylphosphatidylglycerol synthetase-like protein (DUF2156 family)
MRTLNTLSDVARAMMLVFALVLHPMRLPAQEPADSSREASPLPVLLQDDLRGGGGKHHAARATVEELTNGLARTGTTALVWRRPVMFATLIALTGALLLALPPLLVYRVTTPADRYDSSLAQSIFILPVAVAGIVTVIQGSLAVAFSLAGVVTAVRFRSALKDTDDAAYIFLAVAIGVAAGAAALDIATVLAAFFCAALLLMWAARQYAVRTGGRGWVTRETSKRKRKQGAPAGGEARPDGDGETDRHTVLIVRASEGERARRLVEPVLADLTKSWALQQVAPERDGSTSLTYVVHLRKHMSPAGLGSAIEAAGSAERITATVAQGQANAAATAQPRSPNGASAAPALTAAAATLRSGLGGER